MGFLNNLTEEERQALEDKKARAAMAVLAARERANAAKAKEEFAVKKSEWKKKRMYVKGSKVCEANRIYEQGGWFICEVCDKRLQDIPWVEEHVATAKHQRNMEWYATHPLPTTADDFHTPSVAIPACVEWVESEEIYLCTLCNAKAACDAVLQAHLGGKEHAKRVANADWYQTTSGLRSGPDRGIHYLPVLREEDEWQRYARGPLGRERPFEKMLQYRHSRLWRTGTYGCCPEVCQRVRVRHVVSTKPLADVYRGSSQLLGLHRMLQEIPRSVVCERASA